MTDLVKNEPLVVLADKDLSHIDFYQQVLGSNGYWLRSVATPAKLTTILDQHPVNVLVLDIAFPFEGGGDLMEEISRIRQLPTCRNSQIVITSSAYSVEEKQEAYRAGATDYVVYPIAAEELYLKMGFYIAAGAKKNVASALSRSFNVLSEANMAMYPMIATATSCSQTLGQTSLSNKQALYLESLTRSLKRASVICDNLRDFEELSTKHLVLENTPFDLDQLLQSLRDYLLSEAESRSVELLFNVPLDVPRSFIGDPDRLRRVLLNIIDEAMIVGEGCPLILSIDVSDLSAHSARLEISINQKVTDDEEAFDDLEELSERLSCAKSELDESINLFVATCLIEQMDGQIHLDSDDKEPGVYFNLQLQLAAVAADKSFSVPVDLRGLRVLIVDDNPSSVAVHQAIVESLGFVVQTVSDVDSAFTAIEEGHLDLELEPFDLVLLDWHMPGKKGFHLLEKLQDDLDKSKHPVVIVISAYDQSKIAAESGRGKIDGYLHKPISASVMFDTIMEVMGQNLPKTHRRIVAGNHQTSGISVSGGGRRVLVVDDMPINQQIAREVLISNGFQVDLAASGREAIMKVCPTPELYDAVLMDLEMPDMNGLEATRIIRETSDKELLPIFAVTAHTMERDRQRCFDAGMNDHIAKPLDANNLLQKLAGYLGLAVSAASVPERASDVSEKEEYEFVDIADGIKRVMGNEALYFKLLSDFVHQARGQENQIYAQIESGQLSEAAENAHTIAGSAGNLSLMGLRRSAKQLQNALLALGDYHSPLSQFRRDMDNAIQEIGEILLKRNQTAISPEPQGALPKNSDAAASSLYSDPAFVMRMKTFHRQMQSQDLVAIDTYYQLLVDYSSLATSLKPVGDKLIQLDYVKAMSHFQRFVADNQIDLGLPQQTGASHAG